MRVYALMGFVNVIVPFAITTFVVCICTKPDVVLVDSFNPIFQRQRSVLFESYDHNALLITLFAFANKCNENVVKIDERENEEANQWQMLFKASNSAVLKIRYDGSYFNGWSSANDEDRGGNKIILAPEEDGSFPAKASRRRRKRRPSQIRSVEGTLRKCLAKVYGDVNWKDVNMCGCSRTDKGVHARSMIAAFSYQDKPLPFRGDLQKLVYVLNRMLPFDVRVENVSLLPVDGFHPTLNAVAKTYTYTFSIGVNPNPMRWRHEWQIETEQKFDLDSAIQVSNAFIGSHDFTAFKGAYRGNERGKEKDPMCCIKSISISKSLSDTTEHKYVGASLASISYLIEIEGDRFLYKMARYMSSALISAGLRETSLADIENALEVGTFSNRPPNNMVCAPAHGLVLSEVVYDDDLHFSWIY